MILTKNWPEVRYTHATGEVMISASALEARLRTAVKALRLATEKVEEWHEQIEPGDNSEGTVFGYCRGCGTVEYREHRSGCEYIALRDSLRAVLTKLEQEGFK